MTDLSAIRGDTNTYSLPLLRRWTTTLDAPAVETDTTVTLADDSDAAEGDLLVLGTESRIITDLTASVATFTDPLTADHGIGSVVTGSGAVDLDSATVEFSVGFLGVTKAVTIADPITGAAVVTLEPDDTEKAPGVRRAYPYQMRATYPSGTVHTLAHGLLAVVPDVE